MATKATTTPTSITLNQEPSNLEREGDHHHRQNIPRPCRLSCKNMTTNPLCFSPASNMSSEPGRTKLQQFSNLEEDISSHVYKQPSMIEYVEIESMDLPCHSCATTKMSKQLENGMPTIRESLNMQSGMQNRDYAQTPYENRAVVQPYSTYQNRQSRGISNGIQLEEESPTLQSEGAFVQNVSNDNVKSQRMCFFGHDHNYMQNEIQTTSSINTFTDTPPAKTNTYQDVEQFFSSTTRDSRSDALPDFCYTTFQRSSQWYKI